VKQLPPHIVAVPVIPVTMFMTMPGVRDLPPRAKCYFAMALRDAYEGRDAAALVWLDKAVAAEQRYHADPPAPLPPEARITDIIIPSGEVL